jgi:hypothetical protein
MKNVRVGHPSGFDGSKGVILHALVVRKMVREKDACQEKQAESDHQSKFVFAGHALSVRAACSSGEET